MYRVVADYVTREVLGLMCRFDDTTVHYTDLDGNLCTIPVDLVIVRDVEMRLGRLPSRLAFEKNPGYSVGV